MKIMYEVMSKFEMKKNIL